MPGRQHIICALLLGAAGLQVIPCQAADLQEIIGQGTQAIRSDWAAWPDYAYIERDETVKNGKTTSKTSLVVMIAGSDYYMPMAVDDEPLPLDRQKAELGKLKAESLRRNQEDATTRARRIANYRKQHDENNALLLDFPNAFTFQVTGEDTRNGFPAYVLSAAPLKRTGPLSRAAKMLTGMHGTLWIDRAHFHTIRAECTVVNAVPVYGMLARVLPGTHVELELAPVTDSIWLIRRFSMSLTVSKLFWFSSTQVTNTAFSDYRLNSTVLDELLSRAE